MSASREHVPGRLAPLRVAVVSRDHHYRAAMSLLLARRNCLVTVLDSPAGFGESLAAQVCDVAVLDASAEGAAAAVAALVALPRRIGVVVVSDGSAPLGELPEDTMAKWGPFDELMAAVERAPAHGVARGAFEARE